MNRLSREQIASELQQLDIGEVRFDHHNRMLYSTDASIYQVEPIGVVIPSSIDQVERLVTFCGKKNIPLLPRGGGTSLAGQSTNEAIVLDLSAFCRRIISVDAPHRECHVEPGITIEGLNAELSGRKIGLLFAPDPATLGQAAIGGCIGNNAAGARSIRYGRTSENIAGIDLVLSTGERTWLAPGAGRTSPVALRLAKQVAEIVRKNMDFIRARFPKIVRRNAGLGLDLVLQQLDAGVSIEDLDLSGLICGSEGILGVVVGAKLKLHPVPIARGLALLSFPSLEEAIDAVVKIVGTNPTAVELLDEVVLTAAAENAQCRKYLEVIPKVRGELPKAVLYVEYSAEQSASEIEDGFARLHAIAPEVVRAEVTNAQAAQAWALRKAGEPLLHGLSATRKPQTFVEDNSIPVENLSRFVREFKQIVAKHGTTAAYWAHASVGVLHIRPMIDLHDSHDRDRLRAIAVEVADLARDCGGVMSGEHGDGRIRGPLLERFFGPELMAAFRETKAVFDPAGIFNPGDIVGAGDVRSITDRLRVIPENREIEIPPVETFFNYDDAHGFAGAVEMCNGAGVCRKTTAGGTMCPSFRATLDERHSTRGRGNALRLAISGQLSQSSPKPAWSDPGTIETLDLCLSCKACKSECPSSVDVARLKAEFTAQRYRDVKPSFRAKVFGHIRTLNQMGSTTPRLANRVSGSSLFRAVANRALGLSDRRSLPMFSLSLFRWYRKHVKPTGKPKVILYGDCFTSYNESHIGQAAIHVLQTLGYDVILPWAGCCGRAMISNGLLGEAITTIDATVSTLAKVIDESVAMVVVEPSCLSAILDEWQQLKLKSRIELRKAIAGKSMLVEDFVERLWDQHPRRPVVVQRNQSVLLHGHCHQKALWGDAGSAAALRRVCGDGVRTLSTGCCGMAGAFGYTADHYEVSMKIGALSVFGPVAEAGADVIVAAPGTSCRHQIRDGTGKIAVHPLELLCAGLSEEKPRL